MIDRVAITVKGNQSDRAVH